MVNRVLYVHLIIIVDIEIVAFVVKALKIEENG